MRASTTPKSLFPCDPSANVVFRHDDILVGIRDGVTGAFDLLWRPEAKVSVLDSGFVLGDGVWEGIRLHRGVLLFGEKHLDRLYEGAKALNFDLGIGKRDLERLIYATCDANGMTEEDHVHIRVMVTRGLKSTPYQNPKATVGDPTIVIVPEYKQANPTDQGIWLFTCHVRRSSLDVQDPMLNTHSKHNCIAACIQANECGADEALMLDPHGFVATCNSVNFFIVRKVQASKIAILL
uniref:Aminotransferase class iv n=1 Tax=Tetraselmis sp. GSL018 TaxID=582737 RepID=A0A061QSJ0_9CHLO|eukprot:CAMPEP_0177619498 /NCGR_PEP_ID=MMETSP0419_2-20121207/26311_1 /TAXON_ID=582737 /ORGANISM="Tetraselmis sp., Strain GSL018" /LENGTH=236 /DNA_ID=CAMNT_0019118807 /DNA_START=44 /DNA_END=754 /DNA_ORIENTATION=+